MISIKSEISQNIHKIIKDLQQEGNFSFFEIPEISVEPTKDACFGDYSANIAFKLAKIANKSPKEIGEMIASAIKDKEHEIIKKIEIVNGFINIFIKEEYLENQINKIIKLNNKFGANIIKKKEIVVVDYSAPNVAKPMHIGHLRSTIIGQAICNIYKFLGYKVIADNHIGDWGKQFGIMIAAIKKNSLDKPGCLKKITIEQMLGLYVKYNKEMKNDASMDEIASQEFKKLESGDLKNRKIWKIIKNKSIKEFNKIYKILKIKFDICLGESFYEKYLDEEIKNALNENIATQNSDGSVIIALEKFGLPPILIKKSNGATLYLTRDLATIRYRIENFSPKKIIYVVGNEQTLYFEQLFRSAEILNYITYDSLKHIKFGLVLDKNHKKLATREGRFISAENLINQIILSSKKIIQEKNTKFNKKEKNKISEIIGVGSLKYNELSQNRQSDIVFDEKKMLSFKGNSAPYLLYTYARLQSILRKAGTLKNHSDTELTEKEELEILKKIVIFPDILIETSENFQINNLSNYLYNLSNLINSFYEKLPILKAENKIKNSRLALIKASAVVLKNGLNLLGIETLNKM